MLWISLLFGAIPLGTGLLALGSFWLTRSFAWVDVGLRVLASLPFFLPFGLLSLRLACAQTPRGDHNAQKKIRIAGWLLASNIPIAGICVYLFLLTISTYRISIINNSRRTLTDITLTGGGFRKCIDQINPGGTQKTSVTFTTDGVLRMRAKTGDQTLNINAGYITSGMAGGCSFTIGPDGTWAINREMMAN